MFCMAAHSLGYKVCVLDPGADSPAGAVADRHLQADYQDPQALAELARLCRAATTEVETVPAGALEDLADHCVVSPAGASVAIAQDRIVEKAFVSDCAIAVAPHAAVRSKADLNAADGSLFPAILKAARLGYDGKGQARVQDPAQAAQAFEAFGEVDCVLEKRLDLAKELSVVVARGFDGLAAVFPVSENEHRGGIL
ncbi:MAG: ATP-grasp domain-containing protein, partial [Quisquiliibacterium sp.]